MLYVKLEGHDFKYEVGELLKAFSLFNSIRFIEEDEVNSNNNADSFFLINKVRTSNDCSMIESVIYKNGEKLFSNNSSFEVGRTNNLKPEIIFRKELKRNIKLNIYDTICDVFSVNLPWGILTGIRPTKIVHEYMDQNIELSDISSLLNKKYRLDDEKITLLIDIALRERRYIENQNTNMVSIYVSIPFCPSRCVYCSFPSNPIKGKENYIDNYLEALYEEIDGIASILKILGKTVETIYIGGGTPTTLSPVQMDKLIQKLYHSFDISKLKEVTVEAGRPDTITLEKLKVLKKNGVNRISINPQTMNEGTLNIIGRKHSGDDIKRAFYMARDVGFKTINMDIIVGLPGEGINEITKTLEIINDLEPENLTVHTLAIKKSSTLKEHIDEYATANEKLAIEMLDITKKHTKTIGLFPYYMYRQKYMVGNLENIGYAKEGHECIYNIQIMEERQSIIALGAGAVSKIIYPKENRLQRVPNVKSINDYISRVDEMIARKKMELSSQK